MVSVAVAVALAFVAGACGPSASGFGPSGRSAPSDQPGTAFSPGGTSSSTARPSGTPTPTRSEPPPIAVVQRTPYVAPLVRDPCTDRDLPAPVAANPAFTVLDRSYGIGPEVVPDDLVPASKAGFSGASGSRLVQSVVIPDLAALRAAARQDGLAVVIASAYRSYAQQAVTFRYWVSRLGANAGSLHAARAGHSEHQLGTALDLDPAGGGTSGVTSALAPAARWLAGHAWEYGFVMSYPEGSTAETCYTYEPWHFRWIGREAAAAQHASGLTLHAWLAPRPWGFDTRGQ